MCVENYAAGDALDMTWVRFNSILKSIPAYLRIEKHDPMSHEECIEMQKEDKEMGY